MSISCQILSLLIHDVCDCFIPLHENDLKWTLAQSGAHLQSSVKEMHLKGLADNHMIRLCSAEYEIVHSLLNISERTQCASTASMCLSFSLSTKSSFLVGPWLCEGVSQPWCRPPPVRHSVPASHSGIQYSGFPLQWLQKYRWAHSRWTCHSQHLQDPNSQQGKTEGQRKFCCEEFCWATWGA